uniref:Uncharacterized protein n=1 Tax=Meloidogyne hapla TaxID=6305 RepID=A0A1I8B6G4_MELHA
MNSKMKEVNKLMKELTETNENILDEKNELNSKIENLNKENIELREEKYLNLKELNNYRSACQVPTDEKMTLVRQNNKLSIELQHANSELTKYKNEIALNTKLVRFVSLNNRIDEINDNLTCCSNKCINSNLANSTCTTGNGFVRVHEDGIVKYQ